jgi:hypothetical protein
VLKASIPLLLGWPAIFLTLGWNFLEDGFDPPAGQGVLLVVLGGAPLLLWLSVVRDARRTRRAQVQVPVAAPTPVPTRMPPPRRPEPPPVDGDPRASAMSVAGRLEWLAPLHASGALTDDEYAQAKKATLQEELDR